MRKNYTYERRKYIIGAFMLAVILFYVIRLFSLQVLDNRYNQLADNNAIFTKVQYPSRGLIYDRNGRLVVDNQPAYDLMVIPREVEPFDTLDLCRTLGITLDEYKERWRTMSNRRLNPGYSSFTPQLFFSRLTVEEYGVLQEKLYRYPGFYIQNQSIRRYVYDVGANVLGNVREVSLQELRDDSYYMQGDYTGDLGVEKSYESYLRGEKGQEYFLRNAYGRIKGRYENGAYDHEAVPGKNLTLSIDIELQQYGEMLMQNKVGAIVAIEPSTGEILALVSSPTYKPSMLTGRERGHNYTQLFENPYKPLYDRSIMATYPPGSTFKPTQALIFLQEKVVSRYTAYPCNMGFYARGIRVGCHAHESPISVVPALSTSCNAYFCYAFRSMIDNVEKYGSTYNAFETWKKYIVDMGYGYRLGVDMPGESRGFIPNSDFYGKIYGPQGWKGITVISVSIGQGEVLATPLQIANLGATIANRGYYFTPHVVKSVQDTYLGDDYTRPHYVGVDPSYYEMVVEGMRMSMVKGTCRIGEIPGIEACGKTGTAQNPHGDDHSAFMGFAPRENPRIAIAVYVENAGWGAAYGVPIGSLMMEKYLTGEIAPSRKWLEERMLNANTMIQEEEEDATQE